MPRQVTCQMDQYKCKPRLGIMASTQSFFKLCFLHVKNRGGQTGLQYCSSIELFFMWYFGDWIDSLARACPEIKILRPMSLGFWIFHFFFFAFPFPPFLIFLLQWLTCLQIKKLNLREGSSRWAIFTMEWPCVEAENFALSFSLNIFEHFCAYLKLH